MKAGHPIHVDRARESEPPGGDWGLQDPVTRGQVQILPAGDGPITQAQAVVAELQRLATLEGDWDWSSCAVIAREWSFLDPIRSLCELAGIPVQMANEDFTGFWHLRETRALVHWAWERESKLITCEGLKAWLDGQLPTPWIEVLAEAVSAYDTETGGTETPVDHFVEWLAEWGRGFRRRQRGLLLLTAHRAKGLEFDHVVVLDGGWDRRHGEDADAPRRLYYVAMTRARKTLALARLSTRNSLQVPLGDCPAVLHRETASAFPAAPSDLSRRYRRLTLRDVFLSFAGYRAHAAIADLVPGDALQVRAREPRWELLDRNGTVVGELTRSFAAGMDGMQCTSATVLAIAAWDRNRSEPEYRPRLRCDAWEVVVPELMFEPSSAWTDITIKT